MQCHYYTLQTKLQTFCRVNLCFEVNLVGTSQEITSSSGEHGSPQAQQELGDSLQIATWMESRLTVELTRDIYWVLWPNMLNATKTLLSKLTGKWSRHRGLQFCYKSIHMPVPSGLIPILMRLKNRRGVCHSWHTPLFARSCERTGKAAEDWHHLPMHRRSGV